MSRLENDRSAPETIDPKLKVDMVAHCTIHGWGSWSNQIAVPEFSQLAATIILAFAGSLLVVRRVTRLRAASMPDRKNWD